MLRDGIWWDPAAVFTFPLVVIWSGGGSILFRAAQQSRNEPIEALDLLGNLGNEVCLGHQCVRIEISNNEYCSPEMSSTSQCHHSHLCLCLRKHKEAVYTRKCVWRYTSVLEFAIDVNCHRPWEPSSRDFSQRHLKTHGLHIQAQRTRIKKPSWKMSWSKSWVEALLATASGCLSSTHIQTPRTGRSSGSRGPPSALSFQCRLLIWISEQSEFRTSQYYDDPNWSNIPCISKMKHRRLKHVEAKLLSEPYFVRRWKSPESSSLPKAPLTPQIYVYIHYTYTFLKVYSIYSLNHITIHGCIYVRWYCISSICCIIYLSVNIKYILYICLCSSRSQESRTCQPQLIQQVQRKPVWLSSSSFNRPLGSTVASEESKARCLGWDVELWDSSTFLWNQMSKTCQCIDGIILFNI